MHTSCQKSSECYNIRNVFATILSFLKFETNSTNELNYVGVWYCMPTCTGICQHFAELSLNLYNRWHIIVHSQ